MLRESAAKIRQTPEEVVMPEYYSLVLVFIIKISGNFTRSLGQCPATVRLKVLPSVRSS